jgi:outer membrane biosynthesis protein TonB
MKALGNEIELQATRTRETFDRCYFDAGGAGAIHGVINVAFQVLTDGRIANVSAVENTTGSLSLANCLTGSIAHWTFASHPATNANFVRPFNYP